MAESQRLVWNEHFATLGYEAASAAIAYLERNSRHRPALSDFHEAYATQRHAHGDRAVSAAQCGMCDDGWVQTRCAICDNCEGFQADGICPRGPGTAARCPNGCKPITPDERAARDRRHDDQFDRDRRKRREIHLDLRTGATVRDPSEPNDRQESEIF